MTKEEQVKNSKAVVSYNDFKTATGINRLYLNLVGYNNRFHGDRSCKIYFDRKSSQLVFQNGKGYRSSDFQASIDAIDTEIGFDREC